DDIGESIGIALSRAFFQQTRNERGDSRARCGIRESTPAQHGIEGNQRNVTAGDQDECRAIAEREPFVLRNAYRHAPVLARVARRAVSVGSSEGTNTPTVRCLSFRISPATARRSSPDTSAIRTGASKSFDQSP